MVSPVTLYRFTPSNPLLSSLPFGPVRPEYVDVNIPLLTPVARSSKPGLKFLEVSKPLLLFPVKSISVISAE